MSKFFIPERPEDRDRRNLLSVEAKGEMFIDWCPVPQKKVIIDPARYWPGGSPLEVFEQRYGWTGK